MRQNVVSDLIGAQLSGDRSGLDAVTQQTFGRKEIRTQTHQPKHQTSDKGCRCSFVRELLEDHLCPFASHDHIRPLLKSTQHLAKIGLFNR
jgi:hypothetical protein